MRNTNNLKNLQELRSQNTLQSWAWANDLIRRGAYEEMSSEHYENDTWPEDGVEETYWRLQHNAWQYGMHFTTSDGKTWQCERMSTKERDDYRAAQVEDGDNLEVRGLYGRTEHRGRVTLKRVPGRDRPIILVPGGTKFKGKVVIQPHRIQAVWRDGKEVARFYEWEEDAKRGDE